MGKVTFSSSYPPVVRTQLRNLAKLWHGEVAKLLPSLPAEIDVEFDNDYLVPDSGTGGAAWDIKLLKLAYDSTFDAEPQDLIAELRATYFHEAYHLARGFSFLTTPSDLPAIQNAIEEGLATKFELLRANSKPSYGNYTDRATMLEWLKEVKSLPDGFDYDWERWKFFDPETGRKWILYKVGVFIVDEVMKHNPGLTIEQLANLSTAKVLALSKLP